MHWGLRGGRKDHESYRPRRFASETESGWGLRGFCRFCICGVLAPIYLEFIFKLNTTIREFFSRGDDHFCFWPMTAGPLNSTMSNTMKDAERHEGSQAA